ncbi:YccT family protein [Vibrio algarum]|uniref:DUF2057 family protein n=1 Tax=Vibrio algarum TaxID=3020714 RepID=A0ABT4YS25_9VIBR|nr:DUF2057 family protein [Vibrio sp. KJ40-1]MDB1124339.1 DUF2057 family protein [Vibrio sp. KJ40-1]
MKKVVSVCMFSLLFSGASLAAEIIPTQNVRLLVVNQVETESTVEVTSVKPGFTQIVVRMTARLGKGSSKQTFDSAPYLLQFDAKEADIEIVAPTVYSHEQAKNHFKKTPDWKLISNGKDVDFTMNKLPPKPGFMPYKGIENMVVEYNQSNGIMFGDNATLITTATVTDTAGVAAATTATAATVSTVNEVKSNGSMSSQPGTISNTDQLKAWYLKASKAERKEFRKWMIDQE